jgi:long-chain fatty acid transport protein
MTVFNTTTLRAALVAALGAASFVPAAHATNGYFPHGFGIKAQGMGGAAIATANDAFAGVNNPAAAVFSGNRMELGGAIFSPRRSMSRTNVPAAFGPAFSANEASGRNTFLIPEFGYNAVLSDKLAVGLAVYGNGGMNSSYPGGSTICPNPTNGQPVMGLNPLCGQGKLGVDLMQLIVAPSVAYQVAPNHSVGVSPLLVLQKFEAYGTQGFSGQSAAPSALSNNGKDTSTGVGIRLGYMGKLSDTVSVGASFSPEIGMSRLEKYAGLFAEQGKFNIPANYGVGAAVQVTPAVQLAVDYTRINYSKVASIGNPALSMSPMGSATGGGFGWRDVETLKVGVQWQMNPKTTLRVGVNRGTNPVTGANITPNILAPGVMTTHLTLGGTYNLTPKSELSWVFAYAPKVTVTGASMFNYQPGMPPGTSMQESVSMKQTTLGVQYGWKF